VQILGHKPPGLLTGMAVTIVDQYKVLMLMSLLSNSPSSLLATKPFPAPWLGKRTHYHMPMQEYIRKYQIPRPHRRQTYGLMVEAKFESNSSVEPLLTWELKFCYQASGR